MCPTGASRLRIGNSPMAAGRLTACQARDRSEHRAGHRGSYPRRRNADLWRQQSQRPSAQPPRRQERPGRGNRRAARRGHRPGAGRQRDPEHLEAPDRPAGATADRRFARAGHRGPRLVERLGQTGRVLRNLLGTVRELAHDQDEAARTFTLDCATTIAPRTSVSLTTPIVSARRHTQSTRSGTLTAVGQSPGRPPNGRAAPPGHHDRAALVASAEGGERCPAPARLGQRCGALRGKLPQLAQACSNGAEAQRHPALSVPGCDSVGQTTDSRIAIRHINDSWPPRNSQWRPDSVAQTITSDRARYRLARRRSRLRRRDDREHSVSQHRALVSRHLDLDAVVGSERVQHRIRRVSHGGRTDRGRIRAPTRVHLRPGAVHRRLAAVRNCTICGRVDLVPGCAGARRCLPGAIGRCAGPECVSACAPRPWRRAAVRSWRGRRRPRSLARRAARRCRKLAPRIPGERPDRCGDGTAGPPTAGGEPGTGPPADSRPAWHPDVCHRDRGAGPRRPQGPGMGLGQRTDHRLSGSEPRIRRLGRLALHLAPLADHRPVCPESPNLQRCQCDDGHRGGWLLRLHPLECLVPYRRSQSARLSRL